ncbi:RHS repeat-associated core domain-containing protein [Streptomyces sp. NPDC085931]|uniref:RHS repeat-associated core domain-containing protein n=1 Tax=Streptomyces sp. NPDC085931 TaxID=3365740 RepID=UPI0037D2CB79
MDTGFIREPAGTLNSMTTGGKSCYYLTDATGNVLGLTDDTGKRTHTYAYGPTGLPRGTTTEAAPQPDRNAGTYLDPTGLYKTGHRYYDPSLGRFTQPDPSGQETNPYLYAGGDFIHFTDPAGLGFLDAVSRVGKKSIATAAGGGVTELRPADTSKCERRQQDRAVASAPSHFWQHWPSRMSRDLHGLTGSSWFCGDRKES